MKKLAALFAVAAICFTMTGCGAKEDLSIDTKALADELKNGITFQDTLEVIDQDMIAMVYDVGDNVESKVVYMGSGATAEEIAVFACKDADTAKNTVEPIVQQHIKDQITSFESYVPGEVAKLKDAVVKSGGKYVAVCVSDDSDAARKIMDKYFK